MEAETGVVPAEFKAELKKPETVYIVDGGIPRECCLL